MTIDFRKLARRQVSESLAHFSTASAAERPRDGWIATVREALDMTIKQLAERLNVAPSSVLRLEQRERDDAVTLGALRRAANALDCDLVYAIVPRSPSGSNSLDALIAKRASTVAASEFSYVAQSMALEAQSARVRDRDALVEEWAAALALTPRKLWDVDVGERPQKPAKPRKKASR